MIQTKLLSGNSIRKQTWMLSSWIQDHPYAAAHINRAYSSQYLQVPSWTQQFFRLKLYLTNCSAEPKFCLSQKRCGRHNRANEARPILLKRASTIIWWEMYTRCALIEIETSSLVELWSSTLLRWKFDTAVSCWILKSSLWYSNSVLYHLEKWCAKEGGKM